MIDHGRYSSLAFLGTVVIWGVCAGVYPAPAGTPPPGRSQQANGRGRINKIACCELQVERRLSLSSNRQSSEEYG